MKKRNLLIFTVSFALFYISNGISAQEEGEKPSKFSAGADFYSNYIWRGSKLGQGPAFQPSVKFSTGGFTLGAWGSFDASGYTEADLFALYEFNFGLSLGISDYYYPTWDGEPLSYFDYSDTTGSHAFEINAGYSIGGLSLGANYIINEAGGAGSVGGDMYFQAGYEFKYFNIFLGAGDGWHTSDGEFAICNIGLGTTREIKITDHFSLPVTGQVILNPEKEQFFVVVGFTL
jgi:hypothetical protein